MAIVFLMIHPDLAITKSLKYNHDYYHTVLVYNHTMDRLQHSPNYHRHKDHTVRVVSTDSDQLYRLECADCPKRNFIAWLNPRQAQLVWEVIDAGQ